MYSQLLVSGFKVNEKKKWIQKQLWTKLLYWKSSFYDVYFFFFLEVLYLFSFAFKIIIFPSIYFCGLRTLTATHENGTAGRLPESWDCCFFEKGSEHSRQEFKTKIIIKEL